MNFGVRDNPTHANVELLAKQILAAMRNRLREMSTSKLLSELLLEPKTSLLLLPLMPILENEIPIGSRNFLR
eukprot:3656470-Amphidinium_carterae.1